jgi:site-specific DNA-methyltransferase (adenine-specific)
MQREILPLVVVSLARKPLAEPTVARNAATLGTGGLNIDACRVPAAGGRTVTRYERAEAVSLNLGLGDWTYTPHPNGRHPANVILQGRAGHEALPYFFQLAPA